MTHIDAIHGAESGERKSSVPLVPPDLDNGMQEFGKE